MKIFHISSFVKPADAIPIWIERTDERTKEEKVHQHDCVEIMYIRKGSGRCSVNKCCYPVVRGDVFFFFPGDIHEFVPAGALSFDTLLFSLEAFSTEERRVIENQPLFAQWCSCKGQYGGKINIHLAQTIKIEELLTELAQECRVWNPESNLIRKSIFIRLLFHFLRRGTLIAQANDPNNMHLSELFDYIARHYAEHLTVEKLAKVTHVSPNYLNELIQKTMGQSITDYILRYRVEQAKIALDNPNYTISWIACCSGFYDASHFTRIFKHYTGMTPGKYRKLKEYEVNF